MYFKVDIIISKNVNDVRVYIKTFLTLVFPETKYIEKWPKRRLEGPSFRISRI